MNPSGPVVDASVAMKWLVTEELADVARQFLRDQAAGRMFAPPFLPSEITNALYQRLRRGNITSAEAEVALLQFLRLHITLLQPDGLYQNALAFARSNGLRATYDSLYIVLAQFLATELWTADERLLSDVRMTAPWVRWIGDYRSPAQ